MDEQSLVKLYMDLTGSSEANARCVLMLIQSEPEPEQPGQSAHSDDSKNLRETPTVLKTATHLLIGCIVFLHLAADAFATDATNSPAGAFVTSPISVEDAVNLALQQNPSLRRARKEIEASQGVAIQTRAILVPKAGITGNYGATQKNDIDSFRPTPGITFGNSENWATQARVVQSIYEGGRMLSSVRVARLLQQQAVLNYQTAIADTVLAVQVAFFDALLAAQQITVQEASLELLTRELTDTTRRFEAGTVPRFNVLRAEVELANTRPRLITARNNLRIAKNNLANLLGFNVPREVFEDIPLNLTGKLDDDPFSIRLPEALEQALDRRSELEALRKTEGLRKEDLVNAKSGYLPSVQGYAGYDVHNSILSQDLTVERHGWIAGAQLTWNIFDGLRTRGRIIEAKANLERAGIDLEDTSRKIELEVRTAFSNFIEARETIESQRKVVEEAEEALRLARARAEAGTGTQLDVLGAQTSLTQARTTEIEALHGYDVARARLLRSMGATLPAQSQSAQSAK